MGWHGWVLSSGQVNHQNSPRFHFRTSHARTHVLITRLERKFSINIGVLTNTAPVKNQGTPMKSSFSSCSEELGEAQSRPILLLGPCYIEEVQNGDGH